MTRRCVLGLRMMHDVAGLGCLRILKKCLRFGDGGCIDSGSENGMRRVGRWCGKYNRELSSGEGIVIGERPSELHMEDPY